MTACFHELASDKTEEKDSEGEGEGGARYVV